MLIDLNIDEVRLLIQALALAESQMLEQKDGTKSIQHMHVRLEDARRVLDAERTVRDVGKALRREG